MTRTANNANDFLDSTGEAMFGLVRELYPICRSITGDGVRATLDILSRRLPLQRISVPSGTRVFDWEIPAEWNIRDAFVKNARGERVIDFQQSNLHVVSYSTPIHRQMSLQELRPHLHTMPLHPDWIPYRTSYYRESWGFCLSQRQLDALEDGVFEVCIDSQLKAGELLIAETVLPGAESGEILIWTHICHPSLCNDNLSAIAVASALVQEVGQWTRRFTYRFVFAPATIGAIAWLSLHPDAASTIRHGLVLASLGDRGKLTYKRSRRGNAPVDRATDYILSRSFRGSIEDFSPYGYDERQFGSPGFDLPIGRMTRTPNGRYPEYHSSADNLDFVEPTAMAESLRACADILMLLERNRTYINLSPMCEPRLGPRGLLRSTGGRDPSKLEHALFWVLNQSDGSKDLLDIALRSDLAFSLIASAAESLVAAGLLGAAADRHDTTSVR